MQVDVAVYDDHLATHERDNTEEAQLSLCDVFEKEVERISKRWGYLNSQGRKNKSPHDLDGPNLSVRDSPNSSRRWPERTAQRTRRRPPYPPARSGLVR